MNITPQFVKSPAFVKYERLVGSQAYKHITLLGMYCQQSRSPIVQIEEPLDLEIIIGVESGGEEILAAMLKLKLIEQIDEAQYSCTFFLDQNKQLLSNWRNGAMKAQKSKAKKQEPKPEPDDVDKYFEEFYQSDEWKRKQANINDYYDCLLYTSDAADE